MIHISWPKIDAFHNVRKNLTKHPHLMIGLGTNTYKSKIKLHGSNGSISFQNQKIIAQSRNNIIDSSQDNVGFASWVEANHDYFKKLAIIDHDHYVTIFGEWCGSGIQKGTAINQIDKKIFAVFAIGIGNSQQGHVITDPGLIQQMIGQHSDMFVLPWQTHIDLDWGNQDSVEQAVEKINQQVDQVEKNDPWVQATFLKQGIGEGLVFYPQVEKLLRKDASNWLFKAKGQAHRVVKQKAPAVLDPLVAKTIDDFVDMTLTLARLEQAVRETNNGQLDFDITKIGPFIGWISKDISKECQNELEASGINWHQVAKHISTRSKIWFMKNI